MAQIPASAHCSLGYGRPNSRRLSSSVSDVSEDLTSDPIGEGFEPKNPHAAYQPTTNKPPVPPDLNILAGLATGERGVRLRPPEPRAGVLPPGNPRNFQDMLNLYQSQYQILPTGPPSDGRRPSSEINYRQAQPLSANNFSGSWGLAAPGASFGSYNNPYMTAQWLFSQQQALSRASSQGLPAGAYLANQQGIPSYLANQQGMRRLSGDVQAGADPRKPNYSSPSESNVFNMLARLSNNTAPMNVGMETHLHAERAEEDFNEDGPAQKKRKTRLGVPNTPKSLFIVTHDPAAEDMLLITLKKYRCGYCGEIRVSSSAGHDGRIRIRCGCGGKHQDGACRMHAMWTKVLEDDGDKKLTRKDFRAKRIRYT